MIYYSNAKLDLPHIAFIGRWAPFHKGHVAIIQKKHFELPDNPILILIRNTSTERWSPLTRAEYIKTWMTENHLSGTIMIIPNIEGVYWGRGVGYNSGLIETDEDTKKISGTHIRQLMTHNPHQWMDLVAQHTTAQLLSNKVSVIVEHGLVVWLTGCPSSGKTTVATAMYDAIRSQYPFLKIQLLDGDVMRSSPLAQHVGFSPKERADHIIRMGYLAKLFADQGIMVICSFVSPDRKIRGVIKKMIGKHRFIEVYVKASKKTRIQRDSKGLYKKALQGKLSGLTGLSSSYQSPTHPLVTCNTDKDTINQSVQRIIKTVFK